MFQFAIFIKLLIDRFFHLSPARIPSDLLIIQMFIHFPLQNNHLVSINFIKINLIILYHPLLLKFYFIDSVSLKLISFRNFLTFHFSLNKCSFYYFLYKYYFIYVFACYLYLKMNY
jgi:hypothetical protein